MAQSRSEGQAATASRIPTFQTVEEEAEFWDTHSFTEFEDELEEVTDIVVVGLRGDGRLILWLEPEATAALTEHAERLATYPADLARRWILERLGLPPTSHPADE